MTENANFDTLEPGQKQVTYINNLPDDTARVEFFEEKWPHPTGGASLKDLPPHLEELYIRSKAQLRMAAQAENRRNVVFESTKRALTNISDVQAGFRADQDNPYRNMAPSKLAELETQLRDRAAREGISAEDLAPISAADLAREQIEAEFAVPQSSVDHFETVLQPQLAQLEKIDSSQLQALAGALREQVGPENYDRMAQRAERFLRSIDASLTGAMKAHGPTLRHLAMLGERLEAREKALARVR